MASTALTLTFIHRVPVVSHRSSYGWHPAPRTAGHAGWAYLTFLVGSLLKPSGVSQRQGFTPGKGRLPDEIYGELNLSWIRRSLGQQTSTAIHRAVAI